MMKLFIAEVVTATNQYTTGLKLVHAEDEHQAIEKIFAHEREKGRCIPLSIKIGETIT